jgi:membrane-associated HD superfamily phosphohydrolase
MILSFSDQQMITGISIIIGGLSQLQWGIPSYHWQSVVNLAWFSTVTHLITLTALREELRSDKSKRMYRVIIMAFLMIMLICVMGPVGYLTSSGNIPESFPAWCLYQPTIAWQAGPNLVKEYNWLYMMLAIGFLLFSYFTRVAALFSDDDRWYGRYNIPHEKLSGSLNSELRSLESVISAKRGFRKFTVLTRLKLIRSIYALILAGSDLYSSKIWEVRFCLTADDGILLTTLDHLVIIFSCLGNHSHFYCTL